MLKRSHRLKIIVITRNKSHKTIAKMGTIGSVIGCDVIHFTFVNFHKVTAGEVKK